MRRLVHRRTTLIAFGALVAASVNLSLVTALTQLKEQTTTPLMMLNTRYDVPLYLGVVANTVAHVKVNIFMNTAILSLLGLTIMAALGFLAKEGRGLRVVPYVVCGLALTAYHAEFSTATQNSLLAWLVTPMVILLGIVSLTDAVRARRSSIR